MSREPHQLKSRPPENLDHPPSNQGVVELDPQKQGQTSPTPYTQRTSSRFPLRSVSPNELNPIRRYPLRSVSKTLPRRKPRFHPLSLPRPDTRPGVSGTNARRKTAEGRPYGRYRAIWTTMSSWMLCAEVRSPTPFIRIEKATRPLPELQ